MTSGRIRPIAICVIRRGGEILVFEGRDESRGLTFYRPLGGEIEFGERSEDALRRELLEEIGVELEHLRLISVTENLFTFEAEPWHEIVFVYEGRLADAALYDRGTFDVKLDDGSSDLGLWRSLDAFDMTTAPSYPEGLLEVLRDR
jgi:ADP-ribose pyrophosphatase YjhB (NUDIX family)